MRTLLRQAILIVFAASALVACQTRDAAMAVTPSSKGAVELRAMQGRVFDTADRGKVLRTVIATLQDLGYSIEKVEAGAGTVSARKLSALQMSVTVFSKGTKQMVVRANAVVTTEAAALQVDAPEFYQQLFFEPLAKALFLTALQEDTASAMPLDAPAAPAPAAERSGEIKPSKSQ